MGSMWRLSGTYSMLFSDTAPGLSKAFPQNQSAQSPRTRVGFLQLSCASMSSSSYVKEPVPKHRSIDVKVAARRTGWKGTPISHSN